MCIMSKTRSLFTWMVCLLVVTYQAQALPQEVQCTITVAEPTTCYIATPIYLLPGYTLSIVNSSELVNVTRFELRAMTNLDHIPPIIWAVFPNLQEIVMANYASVATLTATDLLYASNLKLLNLKGNKLTTIPYSAFALAKSLEELDLSGNLIATIDSMAFNGLSNLKRLDLSFNRLALIDAFTFYGLPNLLMLDLNHNKIKTIGDGTFNLPKLQILNCNYNDVKLLPDHLFGLLPKQSPPLTYVDFGENKLTHIGASLYSLNELKFLNLTSNKKIDDINLEALAQLPKLEILLLTNSGFKFPTPISALTVTPPEAAASIPMPTSNSPLRELYIGKNKLANPDVLRQLAYFRQLEVLSLEENQFTIIEYINSLPTWFPNLRTIYLGENKLNCAWLNDSIPVFQAANIQVYSIKKVKTWYGTSYQQKLIDMDDCVDLAKIFSTILSWLNKFSVAAN
ncbi:leucine-rich repeats and immunoglobulin-like domains protein 1 [Contarinia nasturtii]|uniref:leucine-rich repeats and immunoglobulin-like domains protein 1 n=1 Tax=Contarinia nasturtii TaxID=265458 RepID=UPI0012D41F8A|nr:leucine-rich repeats and immunoglobulin-like domains protein 1 [Contarinia nasturtii]